MSLVSVSDAAKALGVSTRQLQRLARAGEIRMAARGVVDVTSLERFRRSRRETHRRAWSTETAWAAIDLLDGGDAAWLGQSQRSRLRARLAELTATELVAKTRNRASTLVCAGHSSVLADIKAELITADSVRRKLGLAAVRAVDGYVDERTSDRLIKSYSLQDDELGNVTMRVTSLELALVRELVRAGNTASSLDLAESLDARESGIGLAELDRALEALRA